MRRCWPSGRRLSTCGASALIAVVLLGLATACGGDDDGGGEAAVVSGFSFTESAVAEGRGHRCPLHLRRRERLPRARLGRGTGGDGRARARSRGPDAPSGTFTHWLVYGLGAGETSRPSSSPRAATSRLACSPSGDERLRDSRLRRPLSARGRDPRLRLPPPGARSSARARGRPGARGVPRARAAARHRRGTADGAVLPLGSLGRLPEGIHDLPAGRRADKVEVLVVHVRIDDDGRDVAVDVDDANVDASPPGSLFFPGPLPSPRSSRGRSPDRGPHRRAIAWRGPDGARGRMRSRSASNHPSK